MRISLGDDVLDVLLTDDGSSVVMVGTQVLSLPPLPSLLVQLLGAGPLDLETVKGELAERAGAPPGESTESAVVRLVEQLQQARVVRTEE